MARETWVQSQVESSQRLKKWYLMPPCLTHSIIRYGSRVKWSNPGTGVAPSPTPWCGSYRKRSLRVTLDYGRQLTVLLLIPVLFILFLVAAISLHLLLLCRPSILRIAVATQSSILVSPLNSFFSRHRYCVYVIS